METDPQKKTDSKEERIILDFRLIVVLVILLGCIYIGLHNIGLDYVFWILFCSVVAFGLQWLFTLRLYEIHNRSVWILILYVILTITFTSIPMLVASVFLKTYVITERLYALVFTGVIFLMSIAPIIFFSKKAKKNQNDAKDAYEAIKPIINSCTLLCTIYLFTDRYFLGGSSDSPSSMPGLMTELKTLPFYCYPWSFAITFSEYYIKKKYK